MLRVCTWNINLGLRLDQVLGAVSAIHDFAGIDLFAIQEASVHNGIPDGLAIAAAMGPAYRCHQVAAQTVRGRIQANAMIWNSRRVGVERFDHLRLAGGKGFYKQERNSVVVEASYGRLSVLAYSVHLDIFGAAHKREQLANIFQDRLLRPPADITVVAGDLNLFHLSRWPSWSTVIQAYEADGFADAARSVRWTHSARPVPIKQKLDSILVRSSVTLELESWTIPLRGSDHIPLFANLEPH